MGRRSVDFRHVAPGSLEIVHANLRLLCGHVAMLSEDLQQRREDILLRLLRTTKEEAPCGALLPKLMPDAFSLLRDLVLHIDLVSLVSRPGVAAFHGAFSLE